MPNGPSFAMAVRSVFSDEHGRQARVAAGLETSSKYTWQSSTDRLFAIYDEMVAKYRSQSHMYDYPDFPAEINFAANLTAC
jgi:hypothetical protein